ncbi:MAG: hypothetical protein M5U26_17165 [Planctomycetota bacterium]|nr:hypothetical protein [Planctomycetota bacterium]
MKSKYHAPAMLAACLVALCLVNAAPVLAGDATVTGAVSVTQDGDNVTAVTIKTEDGKSYSVTLDEKGKEVAKHNGKKVTVTGEVAEKDGAHWITVKEAKAAE